MLKGAVFGFGNVGQLITRFVNIEKKYGVEATIAAVCDINESKRNTAEKDFCLKAYADPEKMLNNDLDFVCVLSTNIAHREHVLLAAERNLPIFLEKPIALNMNDAYNMVAAVEEKKLVNIVHYTYRFSAEHLYLKKMIDEGEFGEILSIWARNFRGHGLYCGGARHLAVMNPEQSGGWIIHHACHMADMMIWLGGSIKKVYCQAQSTLPDKSSEEIIWCNVTFTNGAIGMIADTIACLEDRSIGVIGTKASAVVIRNGRKPLIKFRSEGEPDFAPPHILDPMEICPAIDPFAHFLDCIKGGSQPMVTMRDTLPSLAVAIAMKKSVVEKRPVCIAEIGNS